MEHFKGQIVRSLAGHDAGRLYWVIDSEGDFLLLADGKHRRLAQPKRKRARHVEITGMSAAAAGDGALRRALAASRDLGSRR
ncbi:MAG TPA: KOW domain-containing RNA-binding protein [Pseudoflavonifractor sp.]|jgi:ribosomal protein L14E/L6E/L27E|nr:KOW domain-containing RNA-binding protein [Pseudoflavonifractor sp.]